MNPRVHIDISCAQDAPNVERGIPTYARELSLALATIDTEFDYYFVLNSQEETNSALEPLFETGKVIMSGSKQAMKGADVFLDISPFYRSGLPRFKISDNYTFRSYVVHDLIPFIFPHQYLHDPLVKARHYASREFLKQADLLLANSAWTQRDVHEMLKISPHRVVNIGTGTAERFKQQVGDHCALGQLQRQFPSIRAGFLIYTGGSDWRKNIEQLVRGYALLSPRFRAEHQLVLSFRIDAFQRAQLQQLTDSLAVSNDVIITGFVDDNILVQLYQAAELLVFPSIYEGYGLPVAEALACGTPALVGDNSSLIELVPDQRGRFDAESKESIAQAIHKVTRDKGLQAELLAESQRQLSSWTTVAQKANSALEGLIN